MIYDTTSFAFKRFLVKYTSQTKRSEPVIGKSVNTNVITSIGPSGSA